VYFFGKKGKVCLHVKFGHKLW